MLDIELLVYLHRWNVTTLRCKGKAKVPQKQ